MKRTLRSAIGLSSLTVEDGTLTHRVLGRATTVELAPRSLLVFYKHESYPRRPDEWVFFDAQHHPVFRLVGRFWRVGDLADLLAGSETTVVDPSTLLVHYAAEAMTTEHLGAMTDDEAAAAMQPIHPNLPPYPPATPPRLVAFVQERPFTFTGIVLLICFALMSAAIGIGVLVTR